MSENEENGENQENETEENGISKALKVKLEIPEKTEDIIQAQELLKDLRERASKISGSDMSKASFGELKEVIAENQKRKERDAHRGTSLTGGGAAGKAPLRNPNEDTLLTHEFESHEEMLDTLKKLEKEGNPEQKLEAKAILDEFREKGLKKSFKVEVDLLKNQREMWKKITKEQEKKERGED